MLRFDGAGGGTRTRHGMVKDVDFSVRVPRY